MWCGNRPNGVRATVGVVAVLLAAGCAGGSGRDPGDAVHLAMDRLVGIEWRLTQVVQPSGTWSPPPDLEVRLRFDGAGGWSGEACNHYNGSVRIDADVVRFAGGGGTDMACTGQRGVVEQAFRVVVDGQARWLAEGDQLHLDKSDGWGLRFRVSDRIYPAPNVEPLLQGRRGMEDYRFGWRDCAPEICLSWERREAPGKPWGTAGQAWSQPSTAQLLDVVGNALFLAGVVPRSTARVIYQPSPAGKTVELQLFDIPRVSMGRVFAGFVEKPSAQASWRALDAHGRELLRREGLPVPPLPWS